jgi:hypothetical protein
VSRIRIAARWQRRRRGLLRAVLEAGAKILNCCHHSPVNATALSMAPLAGGDRSPQSVEKFLSAWVDAANDYLQRQYREIIQQEPSPEKFSQYKSECKWLLRSALVLESLVKDPEYPAREFEKEIVGKLLQLQESWESLNNPISDAEADAVLQKVFPDEN